MELSHDYPESTKKGGVLESASKRVRMIFSVMASPNRIDILRILNSKGPLTYSELKAHAGFKSKKESGKFAYHLRKLLRQSLVALNKAERRYTITNLGKLVLSLARQIEERSIIESGKMYVRTSNQTIQEFNSHKIIQSLVREGNIPLELAQKITEEVESKIYKFQTGYLTSPLIREIVNSVLIEHGHEEYRNKLARVGIPVFDLAEMISSVDQLENGIEGMLSRTAQEVLGEYLIFNTIPKDIADSHLAGDIHISNPGMWGMVPDTIFIDLNELAEEGIDLKGKFLSVSRLGSIKNLEELSSSLALLNLLLSREASSEVFVDGVTPLLQKCGGDSGSTMASKIARAFLIGSGAPSPTQGRPFTSVNISMKDADRKQVEAVLKGYETYVNATPIPRIGLVLTHDRKAGDGISEHSDRISGIVRAGGTVALSGNPKNARSALGVSKSLDGQNGTAAATMSLQSLAINLPRLAYESNKDEMYFRARLALLVKPAVVALSTRKKTITDLTRKGLLPTLANSTQFMQRGSVNLVVNLVDLHAAVANILGYGDGNGSLEIIKKVIKTSVEVASEKGKQTGDDVGIAMITDDSADRFATLDMEKYGKVLLQTNAGGRYSQGISVSASDIIKTEKNSPQLTECNAMDGLLNGGLYVTMDVNSNKMNGADVKKAIENAAEVITFFRPRAQVYVCGNCGSKGTEKVSRCAACKSPQIVAAN
ncbi:MAG: anaerobic ribonucleoside-triphosphate reductase [Nitrososphaerales archaeon]